MGGWRPECNIIHFFLFWLFLHLLMWTVHMVPAWLLNPDNEMASWHVAELMCIRLTNCAILPAANFDMSNKRDAMVRGCHLLWPKASCGRQLLPLAVAPLLPLVPLVPLAVAPLVVPLRQPLPIHQQGASWASTYITSISFCAGHSTDGFANCDSCVSSY